ncbi:MAG: class I SAM-dependent methyltransferase [Gemmatimonadetes bacterium]|nr:class I SAM-dependent methyltransferase [Gemmatimonadota bacterium]
MHTPLMYSSLAPWWPLFSSPADYAEEAAAFAELLPGRSRGKPEVLELGSGGGNLASHLKVHASMTLVDLAPEMLAVSQGLNPELEHLPGDMRSVDLGRTFDAVLIHDAVMYNTTPSDLQATMAAAARHCRTGGVVIMAPDCTRESYEPDTTHGGEDGPDGRSARYLSWSFDPDPSDTQFETVYTFVMRDVDGTMRAEVDRHVEGFFREAEWLRWLAEAGIAARCHVDAWDRPVFVGTRR